MTTEEKKKITANVDGVITGFYVNFTKWIDLAILRIEQNQDINQFTKDIGIMTLVEAEKIFREEYRKANRVKMVI